MPARDRSVGNPGSLGAAALYAAVGEVVASGGGGRMAA